MFTRIRRGTAAFGAVLSLLAAALPGAAASPDSDVKIEEPTATPLAAAVVIASDALSAATAVPVFDFQIVNPAGTSALPLLVDQLTVTFTAGTAGLADLAGMRVHVSGSASPHFAGTDSTLVTGGGVGGDPIAWDAGAGTLVLGGAAASSGTADLLTVATGDTVRVTVYAWLNASAVTDGQTLRANLAAVSDVVVDGGGATDLLLVGAFAPVQTTMTEQTALSVTSTAGAPGGVPVAVTIPSTATSRAVAVPVFEFKLTDKDDGTSGRAARVDGLTLPIALGGGMAAADVAGASLTISSSEPLNTTTFAATVGGDREINTADDPAAIRLVPVAGGLELRAGLSAGVVGGANNTVADLLGLTDVLGGSDQTATLTVKIWLASSGLTANSTAAFDLKAAHLVLDMGGAGTDVLNPSLDLTDGVATVVLANSQTTTLSDRSTVGNAVTLSSSAVSPATAVDVFDFFVTDGLGGQATKIDSLTIPVTFSGGARFRDLAGARLSVDNGAGIAFAGLGAATLNTSANPTLARLDSVSPTQARLTFRGRSAVSLTDSTADLIVIPDGGAPVAFTLAAWVDTSAISYGATFTFDLLNTGVTLTGRSSDGLAAAQNVTDGVASVAVARIRDISTVPEPQTLTSAAVENTTLGANDDDNAVAVFDFQIVDPLDGAPLRLDGLRLPLTFSGGADFSDVAGARLAVVGLSANDWAGAATTTLFEGDGTGKVELDALASAIDVGVLAGSGTANDGTADALVIPDGETATITVSLWLSAASLVDSSKVGLAVSRTGLILDSANPTTVVAASQAASGAGIIRATTLADNPAVPTATYLSNVHSANGVAVFGFKITDPADGKPTKVDRIALTVAGTGVAAEIADLRVTVANASFTAAADDGATVGVLQSDDTGWTNSGTFPVTGASITLGSAADADGVADLVQIADGTTATFTVTATTNGAVTNGRTVVFDLTSAAIGVDAGITPATVASAIATGQDLTNKTAAFTAATTRIVDLATVANSVPVSSLVNTGAGAVAVFDFTVTDAAGGAGLATQIDEITIPVTLAGVDVADVAGVKVATSGVFAGASETSGSDNALTSGSDAGIELVAVTGGMEIRLGGATAAVATSAANGVAELLAVGNGTAVDVTVSLYLSSSAAALTDGSTLTLNLGAANIVTDNTSDTVIPAQSLTPGVATVVVSATRLAFVPPASTILATRGLSDTIRVAATDVNGNVDRDYTTHTAVSTSTTTGQFSTDRSTFLATSTPLGGSPTQGVLSLFYRDSATGAPVLTATSGTLTSATLAFTVQPFSAAVTWLSPAVGTTTPTDSAGTYHALSYAVTSNDPNLRLEFWVAQSASLPVITSQNAIPLTIFNPDSSSTLGRLRNPTGNAFGPGTNKAPATDVPISVTSQYVYTSGLGVGTWYVYLVRADGDGLSAGGDTLARSGALEVLHYPSIVAFGVTEARDGTIDAATSYRRDSGGNAPNTQIDLLLYAEDHNSNDPVRLYISTKASLSAATVATDTAGTYRIAGTTSWRTDDVGDTLRYARVTISDSLGSSAYHPKGTYYFYALLRDAVDTTKVDFARAQTLAGQQQNLAVNHAPILTFSEPATAVVNHAVASQPQLTLAWNGTGAAGDQDIDDNAWISLWFAPADSVPDAFVDTTKAWLRPIVSGLREDPDGGAADQYAWDLTRAQFDGQLPAAGAPIRVWALLQDAGTTPAFFPTPSISFAYAPALALLNPPPGAVTEVRENETYRFVFDADYVSNGAVNATVRYFLSARDTTALEVVPAGLFTFDTGASSTFPGNYNSFWISGASQVREADRCFDWTPKSDGNDYVNEIVPQNQTTTTFYLYAVINSTGSSITAPKDLKLARAPGRVRINGLGTTLSDPATVASPNQAQVTAGDTIRVLLRGNTNHTAVQGLQLYVNLDSTRFALVDQDPLTAGLQPFGFASGYFLAAVPAQINRLTRSGMLYKLDLDKRNLSAPEDPTDLTLAHLDLVARSFTGTAELNWNLDRVSDPNRIPLFFNASGVLGASFVNPIATFTAVGRGTVSGFLPLQGHARTTDSKVTTFWLRTPGSWLSTTDATFISANDASSSVEGVQVTTGADGSFTLDRVPPGVWELVAKSESYLAGYAAVSVVNGQTLTGIVPTRLTATDDPGELLGGDITGDNKVDARDESALNLAYESAVGDSNFSSAADIDDDGVVRLSDLLLLAANLRNSGILTGVAPVYRTAGAGGRVVLSGLPLSTQAGDEFTVEVRLEGVDRLSAYALALRFDASQLTIAGVERAGVTQTPAVRVGRATRAGRYALAEAAWGGQVVAVDQPLLARVHLRALQATDDLQLAPVDAWWVAGEGAPMALESRVIRALPQRYSLGQNRPNPFNPSTTIAFDLPQAEAQVDLTVFSVTGQPVRRLLAGQPLAAGRHLVSWNGGDEDGRSVASGFYFYVLRAGQFTATRRMVLLK